MSDGAGPQPTLGLALRLMDAGARRPVSLLHNWVRHCEAVAEGRLAEPGSHAKARVAALIEASEAALGGDTPGAPPFAGLAELMRLRPIPPELVRQKLASLDKEADGWRSRGDADLREHLDEAAGTVGRMVAIAAGVAPSDAPRLAACADIAKAVELANIARDLSEDDAIARCYLPVEWLVEMDIPPGEHMRPVYRARVAVLVKRLAAMAEELGASGRAGLAGLPFRLRWAGHVAAGLALDLIRAVQRRGAHAWDHPVRISAAGRARRIARAFAAAFSSR